MSDPLVRWLPIEGLPGYEISDQGGMRSFRHAHGMSVRPHNIYPVFHGDKKRYQFRRDGKYVSRWVHRLVLEAFVGKCPPGYITEWMDECRFNNHVDNLRWVERSKASSRFHSRVRGIFPKPKLEVFQVFEILDSDDKNSVLAEKFGVTREAIWKIRTGRTWSSITGLEAK